MRSAPLALVIVVAWHAARADDARPPDSRASVELADKNGAQHAIVSSKLACGVPAKCPEWSFDLGPAEAASLIAVVDLLGEPTRVRDAAADHAPAATLPASAKLPAVFVRTNQTDAANTKWERWAVVSLEGGRPKLIWRGEIAMTSANGSGFSTTDGVELVATEPGKPLALVFAQTSIPSPREKSRRPAPPVRRRFVVKDGTYQRD